MSTRQQKRQLKRQDMKYRKHKEKSDNIYVALDNPNDKRQLFFDSKKPLNPNENEKIVTTYYVDPRKLTDTSSFHSQLRIIADDIDKSNTSDNLFIIYIEHYRMFKDITPFAKSINTIFTKYFGNRYGYLIIVGDLIKSYVDACNKDGVPLLGALLASKNVYVDAYNWIMKGNEFSDSYPIIEYARETTIVDFGSYLSNYHLEKE